MGDILVVDGNPQRAMQLAQLLKKLGANTRIAGSFFHCLKRIEERKPNLALVAETLPDGRGLKLLPVFDGLCPVVIVGEYMSSEEYSRLCHWAHAIFSYIPLIGRLWMY